MRRRGAPDSSSAYTAARLVGRTPLASASDVWLALSHTACGVTFACTPSRTLATRAQVGATSVTLHLDQLHAGAYFANAVVDLNGRARAYLNRAGALTGPELVIDDRPFQAGDQIVCLRNDYRLGILNGSMALTIGVSKRWSETLS